MKGHISIFAFLLVAFAVQVTEAAYQTVNVDGYLYENDSEVRTAGLSDIVSPALCWANAVDGGEPAKFTIAPPAGTSISSWRYRHVTEGQWIPFMDASRPANVTIKGNQIAWSYESGTYVYLEFILRYITYRIGYVLDRGSWPAGAVHPEGAVVYTNEVVVTNPERAGYDFTGWLPSNSKTPIPAGPSTTVLTRLATNENETVTVTAQWEARTYKLTLDPQGGTGGSASVTATYDADLPAIVPPTREGRMFGGYFSEVGGKGTQYYDAGGNGVRVWQETESRKLYATYTPIEYDVVFHANDGSERTSTEDFVYGDEKALFTKPFGNRTGYDLKGWATDPASSVVAFEDGQKVSNLMTTAGSFHLYAVWEPISYSVTFNSNGGEGMMEPVSLTYGETFTVPPCEFTREASTFRFWSAVINNVATNLEVGAVVSNLTSTAYGEVEFTANWLGSYTLAYDAHGGAGTMTNETVVLDEEHQLASNRFTKTGYHFLGWVTNAESSVVLWTDGAVVTNLAGVAETRTLYAVWGANAYRVTFNPNATDVTGEMAPQEFVYDQAETPLRANAFGRGEFWEFACWTNAETGATYADGAPVRNLTAVPDGEVRLDAVWKTTLPPLSLAMGCERLKWEDDGKGAWTVCETEGLGGVPPCVRGANVGTGDAAGLMEALIVTNGTLEFSYRFDETAGTGSGLILYLNKKAVWTGRFESTEWTPSGKIDVTMPEVVAVKQLLQFQYAGPGAVYLDGMTWTPEGANPGPTDADKVTISSAAVSDGKFTLSFEFDENFDYLLKTNANLLIDSWGVMEVEGTKTGNILTFEPQIIEGQPQLFYKVETIQKE